MEHVRRSQASASPAKPRPSVWSEIKDIKASIAKVSRALKSLREESSNGWNQEAQALIGKKVSVTTPIPEADAVGILDWVDKYNFKIKTKGGFAIYNKGQVIKISPA
jgi:hypothetical protein